jgi:AcrR family transcriptional regulator
MVATESPARPPRLYRGLSAEERHAQRRERLLEAGLELFGTQGYAASSIRAVSAEAGLNSRYFYESFSSREDLLYQLYIRIVEELAGAVIAETAKAATIEGQARAGLEASWRVFTEDPRKARVIAIEVVGVSERLERLRRENRHAFADILVRNAMSLAEEGIELQMDPVLTARSLMGASVEIAIEWATGELDASAEEIVDHLTRIFTAVAQASVAPAGSSRSPVRPG